MHEGKPVLNIQIRGNGDSTARLYIYVYLLNVPSFSSRYFNKIKRTTRLGRLLALSLEILLHISPNWSRSHRKHILLGQRRTYVDTTFKCSNEVALLASSHTLASRVPNFHH